MKHLTSPGNGLVDWKEEGKDHTTHKTHPAALARSCCLRAGKPGLIDLPGPAMFQVIQELAKDLPVYFPEPANMPIIHHIQREQA